MAYQHNSCGDKEGAGQKEGKRAAWYCLAELLKLQQSLKKTVEKYQKQLKSVMPLLYCILQCDLFSAFRILMPLMNFKLVSFFKGKKIYIIKIEASYFMPIVL